MPMNLKNYYKNSHFNFCDNFRISLYPVFDTQLPEPKNPKKTISDFFGNGALIFSGEILIIQKSLVHKR